MLQSFSRPDYGPSKTGAHVLHPIANLIPNFSTSNSVLWLHLKSQQYSHEPPTLVELKDVVNEEVTAINGELLEQVKGNYL